MWLYSNRTPDPSDPLETFREVVREGRSEACLLTPTATLAEHIRHLLAREGCLVRPGGILTLSRFIEPLVTDIRAATTAQLHWVVREVLESSAPQPFQSLAGSAGLRRILASLIEELSAAGCTDESLLQACGTAESMAAAEVVIAVRRRLREQGLLFRAGRFLVAAERLRQAGRSEGRSFFLTGFHTLIPAELAVLSALDQGSICLSLPDSWGAAEVRVRLKGLGFHESGTPDPEPSCEYAAVGAANEQREAEEIARRILVMAKAGTKFRDMGVVMRREHPYAAVIETTFRRFGIPARFYFRKSLARHPLPRYLLQSIKSAEEGWSYESIRSLIASPFSGLGATAAGDALDHWLQERLPASGLPENDFGESYGWWRQHAGKLQTLEHARLAPLEWTRELAGLLACVRMPRPGDYAEPAQVIAWRELATAWTAWDQCLTEAAALLSPSKPVPLSVFRQAIEEILAHAELPNACRRREVVHVMDAYEARQWSLPVVFVCGLIESRFPEYHNEHPLLGDKQRLALRQSGVLLRTAAEHQREEELLLRTAISRAERACVLTSPQQDARSDETLPSLLLDRMLEARKPVSENASQCRPRPRFEKPAPSRSRLVQADLLEWLKAACSVLSPTAVENYLQCPFQFFAKHVLRISAGPKAPADRLDSLLEGDILHKVLAESELSSERVAGIFSRHFASACRKALVPAGWRTEQTRIELESNLKRFLESPPLRGTRTIAVERSFETPLPGGVILRGQMDHVAEVPDLGVVVIDYKYSAARLIRERIRSHERGELVQGGLYLWAASRLFGLPAAGMLYCGLRGEPSWDGWHLPVFGWQDTGEPVDSVRLNEIIERAVEITLRVTAEAVSGRIAPQPASRAKCRWCDYRDICRIDAEPVKQIVAAGGSAA